MTLTVAELASWIDHTLLAPEATAERIDELCDQTWQYGFAAVCVNPVHVRRAAARVEEGCGANREVRRPAVVSVAGFPLGADTTAIKVEQARQAMGDGATEIDMVVNLGALIAGDRRAVRQDIEALAHVVHGESVGGILKVILETGVLTHKQIALGCRCCAEGEADFVKTSTGFHPSGGATVEHVRMLHRLASPLRVKASGGIRTLKTAREMLEAGAVRLGTSSGVAIVEELRRATAR